MFDAAGANGTLPEEVHFAPAFTYCEREPETVFRDMCYAGFGKEFIVLAGAYDIQDIDSLSTQAMEQAASWCAYASTAAAQVWCKKEIVHSLFWGGENDPQGTIRYCDMFNDDFRVTCFATLFEDARTYLSREQQESLCERMPVNEMQACKDTLGVV